MSRFLTLTYGTVSYLLFFGCFLYSIGFVGDFAIVGKTVDSGEVLPLAGALLVNLFALTVFALQHSIMARPAFKKVWTRIIPEPIERSTYVLASTAALAFLYAVWAPIPAIVWDVQNSVGHAALTGVYLGGWGLLLLATFQLDHFDLFGLRQVWLHARGKRYTNHPFATPGLYKWVRHPIYLAWFIIFWATPTMTVGHLLLAVVTTAYIVVATLIEEGDLKAHFGDVYRRYMETTPRFLPRPSGRPDVPAPAAQPAKAA